MAGAALEAIFSPVRSRTAFEETLERLETAIRLGLLEPGARLPAERRLCERLGIARSTLRQALQALVRSGDLVAVRGRGGGTFVADSPTVARPPSPQLLRSWRETCDARLAVELGVVVLAAERATPAAIGVLEDAVATMAERIDDPGGYRRADVRFHVGLAEATGTPRLVAAMTEVQAAMTDLIAVTVHPPEALIWSNAQHARLVSCLERHDAVTAVPIMTDHVRGTERALSDQLS